MISRLWLSFSAGLEFACVSDRFFRFISGTRTDSTQNPKGVSTLLEAPFHFSL